MKNFRSKLGILALALTLATGATGQEKKERHIFLLIGQSNMAGRAAIEEVDREAIEGVSLWQIEAKQWIPAIPPYNLYSPSRKSVKMQRLNCGPGFAKAYLGKHPQVELGIVCAARGGTKIGQWSRETPDDFDLYRYAVEAVKAALATGGELKGILWHQGEGDSGGKGLARYPENLGELISNFREDLNSPRLPFVYSQLGQWRPNYEGFNKMIVKQPANIDATACITTEGLKGFDEAHFDSPAQRELGRRFAAAMETLLLRR